MNKWIKEKLLKFSVIRHLIAWSKRTTWYGFDKVSLYDISVFLYNEYQRNDITFRSYGISFTFFISLFPGVLVLFTLIPYLPIYDLIDTTVEGYINDLLPGETAEVAFEFIHDIGTRERGGLLSFSFLLAIYFSSNGIMAMMRSFEKNYEHTYKSRSLIKKRFIAIALTLSFGLLLVGSVLLITVGTAALDWLKHSYDLGQSYHLGLRALQWLAITTFMYGGITLTYRYGAATHERIQLFSPGAILSTILTILTSVGFALYIENFGNYNKLYGSIGTIIVFMVWLQLNVLWILIGYELNAGIAINRDLRQVQPDEEAD